MLLKFPPFVVSLDTQVIHKCSALSSMHLEAETGVSLRRQFRNPRSIVTYIILYYTLWSAKVSEANHVGF